MSSVKEGWGCQLYRGSGALGSATYESDPVAEILGIPTMPELSREVFDRTNYNSPDGWEVVGGSKKKMSGEIVIDVQYIENSTEIAKLIDGLNATDPTPWKFTFPPDDAGTEGQALEMLAVVTGFSPAAPSEEAMTAQVKFKVSGKPKWVSDAETLAGA